MQQQYFWVIDVCSCTASLECFSGLGTFNLRLLSELISFAEWAATGWKSGARFWGRSSLWSGVHQGTHNYIRFWYSFVSFGMENSALTVGTPYIMITVAMVLIRNCHTCCKFHGIGWCISCCPLREDCNLFALCLSNILIIQSNKIKAFSGVGSLHKCLCAKYQHILI